MKKTFWIDPAFKTLFPKFRLGILVVGGIDNSPARERISPYCWKTPWPKAGAI